MVYVRVAGAEISVTLTVFTIDIAGVAIIVVMASSLSGPVWSVSTIAMLTSGVPALMSAWVTV
jgi:hypothetical protein